VALANNMLKRWLQAPDIAPARDPAE
jgi:hypothetical protein